MENEEIIIKDPLLILVSIKLKESQCIGYNKWKCTINREPREVLMQNIQFRCTNLTEALTAFKEKEVISFSISGERKHRMHNIFIPK